MKKNLIIIFCILISAVIFYVSCKKRNTPPDTPEILNGASNGYAGVIYNFTISATDLNNDSIAFQFNWGSGDSDTSNWSDFIPSEDQITIANTWLTASTYLVKARAKDTKGAISQWSAEDTIVILPNKIPNVPSSPNGPDRGDVGVPYSFKASATDPDEDSVCFIYDWADGLIDSSCFGPSGDTVSLTHSWASGGTYLVKARTKDSKGAMSDWSEACQVTVYGTGNTPPLIPARPDGPALGFIYNYYTFATSTTDPDEDSVAYQFDWDNGDTSEWSPWFPSGPLDTAVFRWCDIGFQFWSDSGSYYVRARAKDKKGAFSNWSSGKLTVISYPDLIKWRYLTGGSIWSSPAIEDDGTIYFGSCDGYLYALNPNGTLKWRFLTGGEIYSSPSIGTDGTIYFGSCDNRFYALNRNGSLKWSFPTRNQIFSSPAIASDGTIYFGSDDSCLYALNPNGTLKWVFPIQYEVRCPPAIGADGSIYFGSGWGLLPFPPPIHVNSGYGYYAVNPDGSQKWFYPGILLNSYSSAIGADGTIYTAMDKTYAFNPDGSVKWSVINQGDVRGSFTIDGEGNIYYGQNKDDYGGFVSRYPDGALRFRYRLGYAPHTAALSDDNLLYVGARLIVYFEDSTSMWGMTTQRFFALKSIIPHPYYEHDIEWQFCTSKVLSNASIEQDGTVYFGTKDGYFYAVRGTSPLANTPWPKFQHDLKNTGRVGGP